MLTNGARVVSIDRVSGQRVAIVGAGPAGLTVARLLKRAQPGWDVTIYERQAPNDSFGYGVGLGYSALRLLDETDPELRSALEQLAITVDTWTIERDGERASAANTHGLGVSRPGLLRVLRDHAAGAGADVREGVEVDALAIDADIVVAADGVGSQTRGRLAADIGARVSTGELSYIWCGASIARPEMTLSIARTAEGPVAAHVMPYAAAASTFQVDARNETVAAWESQATDDPGQLRRLEGLYSHLLGAERLVAKRYDWPAFTTVTCDRWCSGNVVLAGDAAHTAHYTVGSGTGLAVEDAITLAQALAGAGSIAEAFAGYEAARRPRVAQIQDRAARSERWWSTLAMRVNLPLPQLLVSYLTRTGAISLAMLAEQNRQLVESALPSALRAVPPAELAEAIVSARVSPDGVPTLEVAAVDLPLTGLREQVVLAKALVAGGAERVRLAGPEHPDAVRLRLELAEHMRMTAGIQSIVTAPAAARAELAIGVLSGRTELVEVIA